MSGTGVAALPKPMQVTVYDNANKKTVLKQTDAPIENKWLVAQKSMMMNPIVDETSEYSESAKSESAGDAVPVARMSEEESKGSPVYSQSINSDLIKAPVDSSVEIKRTAFQVDRNPFLMQSDPFFEKARNSLTESESVADSDVEVRMRKLQQQIDLKHDNLPAARQFKIQDQALRDSN